MMKMKKLILLIALILGCTLESYAQKSTFQFRDAQSRAGDAVSEVCVKPVVAEVRLLGGETPKRQVFTYKFTREEVEIGLKGDLGNVRSWATYKANEDAGSDVIMAATYKVETNDEGGYTVTVVGFPAVFSKWYTATKDDYEWIRIKKLAPTDEKGVISPVVKTNN